MKSDILFQRRSHLLPNAPPGFLDPVPGATGALSIEIGPFALRFAEEIHKLFLEDPDTGRRLPGVFRIGMVEPEPGIAYTFLLLDEALWTQTRTFQLRDAILASALEFEQLNPGIGTVLRTYRLGRKDL